MITKATNSNDNTKVPQSALSILGAKCTPGVVRPCGFACARGLGRTSLRTERRAISWPNGPKSAKSGFSDFPEFWAGGGAPIRGPALFADNPKVGTFQTPIRGLALFNASPRKTFLRKSSCPQTQFITPKGEIIWHSSWAETWSNAALLLRALLVKRDRRCERRHAIFSK